MDFTLDKYNSLVRALISNDYSFQTFRDFLISPGDRVVILRHDVDDLPQNSLEFAKIQHSLGIVGTYYFRNVQQSWNEKIIVEIQNLGHEVGYHYEDLSTSKGDMDRAIQEFEKNLNKLRQLVDVKTICMHGSPLSSFDSRQLWEKFDYKDFQLIGEPYFDVDFNEVLYLTDTGRRWNGSDVSVRDKVKSTSSYSFRTTDDIIGALTRKELMDKIMFTFHPQRWHDNRILWLKELMFQNLKNQIKKKFFVKRKN